MFLYPGVYRVNIWLQATKGLEVFSDLTDGRCCFLGCLLVLKRSVERCPKATVNTPDLNERCL